MNTESRYDSVALEGIYLYPSANECDIRILYSTIRFGTGDCNDPPEISEDVEQDTFYLQFGSSTKRGVFNTGGGRFNSLAEAVAAAEATPTVGHTIKWHR